MDNFDLKKYLVENRLHQESVEFNKLQDDNEFDDIPTIKMQILKDNPEQQEEVMATLQKEFQKTFRRVIHGILGEPNGLPE